MSQKKQNAPAAAAEHRLVVLLFTDLEGSSGLKTALGDLEYATRIARPHNALFRAILSSIDGAAENNYTGDGFLATFPRVSDAVEAALRFQQEMRTHPWETDAPRTRIGIHVGEISLIEGSTPGALLIASHAADMCARLMSLGSGGQILLTRHAFDDARQYVRRHPASAGGGDVPPLSWLKHGLYRFKGKEDDPLEVFEVGAVGHAPLRAPPGSEKVQRVVRPDEEEMLGWRPAIGQEVPRRDGWILQRPIGAGGFGEVWLGQNRKTRAQRAFKFCFDADRVRSFRRELTLFRLLHEALGDRADIAKLHEVQLDRAPYFLEGEFTPEGDLYTWSRERGGIGTLPLAARLDLFARTAEAVGAAHSIGVLHKDLKPSNILVYAAEDGSPRPRISDFGIGMLADAAAVAQLGITLAGFTGTRLEDNESSRTGTRLYAPPELLAGGRFTTQGDVYALGVLLYQIVVADFDRPLAEGWPRDIAQAVPDPIARDLLQADIASMVDGDHARRPASAGAVAERVRSLDTRRAAAEEGLRIATTVQKRLRARRRTAVAMAVLLFLSAVSTAFLWRERALREEAEAARRSTQEALVEAALWRDAKSRALEEVLRLADSKSVTDLLLEIDTLWPAHPDRAPAMAAWLERATRALSNRPGHMAALEGVRGQALPYAESVRLRDHAVPLARLDAARSEAAAPGATPERIAALGKEIATLEAAAEERASWTFASPEEDWRHQVLADVLAGLARLERGRAEVEQRHEFAGTLRANSIDAHRMDWDDVVEAIAASPQYGGLRIVPQLGLVPLGADPRSGLFEFGHVGSGEMPSRDPETRDLLFADDSAIVLVLLPGGSFRMGAQRADPDAPNHDPAAEPNEQPTHEATLAAFLLAKHECTQAQWIRMTGGENPSNYGPGAELGGRKVTRRNPVEQVSWEVCTKWLPRWGLSLPTEAQWEYACRAGTGTPWFTGREVAALGKFANIADRFAMANGGPASWQYTDEVHDGYTLHAPVGLLAPNAFGLHDVHGNVFEWCRDTYALYAPAAASDPLVEGAGLRVYRGGSWGTIATFARASTRFRSPPGYLATIVGVRPARAVDRP